MSTPAVRTINARLAGVECLEQRRLLSANLAGAFEGGLPAGLSDAGKNRFVVNITNSGDASFNGPVTVSLYASTDTVLDADDIPLATVRAQVHLAASATRHLTIAFATPTNIPDGSDFLVGKIEGAGTATTFASTNPVAVQKPFVDLVTEFVYLPNAPIRTDGNTATQPWTAVRVVNIGNAIARGVVNFGLYLAPGSVLNTSAALASQLKPARIQLRPGGSKLFAARLILPFGSMPGSYTLFGVAASSVAVPVRHPEDMYAAAAGDVNVEGSVPTGTLVANYHKHHHRRCTYYDGSDFTADTAADYGMDEAVVPGDSIPEGFAPVPGPTTSPSSQPSTQPSNDSWNSDLNTAEGDVSASQANSSAGNTDSPGADWGADSGGDSGDSGDGGDGGDSGDGGGDDGGGGGDDGGDD